jgi:hypothetical protein
MKVIEFIRDKGLDSLESDPYFVTVNRYDNGLVVLNYSQIDSPKYAPIVSECRGLILDSNNDYRVVARSFDRFYHYEEIKNREKRLISDAVIFEKIDGSLISAYHYNDEWHVATRKMAVAEGTTAYGNTFRQVFDKAFDIKKLDGFNEDYNYIFELVSPETRVVTPYPNYEVFLLTVRDRKLGRELPEYVVNNCAEFLGVKRPKRYKMNSFDDIVKSFESLPPTDEGYVCLWPDFFRCKIKNPAYLAIANMRINGGINKNSVIHLVVTGNDTDYLINFPEDTLLFKPYQVVMKSIVNDVRNIWGQVRHLTDKKSYAMIVKDLPISHIMFKLYKEERDVEEILKGMSEASLERLFDLYGSQK